MGLSEMADKRKGLFLSLSAPLPARTPIECESAGSSLPWVPILCMKGCSVCLSLDGGRIRRWSEEKAEEEAVHTTVTV